MKAIDNLRIRLHQHFLGKALESTKAISHYSLDYQNAKYIGILFDATEFTARETVVKYAAQLRNANKKVKLLGFLNDRQKQNNFPFKHFSRKELDFALRPTDPAAIEFMNSPFDILLNLYTSSILPLEYISALSRSIFRVGPITDKTYCFDLMVHTNDQTDLPHFITQVEFFLKKIQNQHEANAI